MTDRSFEAAGLPETTAEVSVEAVDDHEAVGERRLIDLEYV